METTLLITGASIFGLLGSAHMYFTFFGDKFEAYNPDVTSAMKSTTPKLTKDTTLWNAWIGFNASHSMGAILLALFYIPLSLFHFEVILESVWFSWLPVLVGIIYLYLAKRYWFKIPFTGILISTLCFMVAAVSINFY